MNDRNAILNKRVECCNGEMSRDKYLCTLSGHYFHSNMASMRETNLATADTLTMNQLSCMAISFLIT